MELNDYPFAVYATQGGGYARFAGEMLIFVEPPPGFVVGQEVPREWDFQPANKQAQKEGYLHED